MATFEATVTALCRNQVDLSTRQLALLFHCASREETERMTKQAAEILCVSKPAITRAADRLEEAGLLVRSTPKEDRRKCLLTLTKRGLAFAVAIVDGGAKAKLVV